MAAARVVITAPTQLEADKKQKSLTFIANNLSVLEIERLEELGRSNKARGMLNENWSMLQSLI